MIAARGINWYVHAPNQVRYAVGETLKYDFTLGQRLIRSRLAEYSA